jgi:hypothetical protein
LHPGFFLFIRTIYQFSHIFSSVSSSNFSFSASVLASTSRLSANFTALNLRYSGLDHIFFLFSIFYFITLAVDSAILRTASCSYVSYSLIKYASVSHEITIVGCRKLRCLRCPIKIAYKFEIVDELYAVGRPVDELYAVGRPVDKLYAVGRAVGELNAVGRLCRLVDRQAVGSRRT